MSARSAVWILLGLLVPGVAGPAGSAAAADPPDVRSEDVVPAPLPEPTPGDLWIHPRGEPYDPARHYRDGEGNLYYLEENQLGPLRVLRNGETTFEVEIRSRIFALLDRVKGSAEPVLLYDTDGDGAVDRSLTGRRIEQRALFEGPALRDLDLRTTVWQVGLLYRADAEGSPKYDGRYLASFDGRDAEWLDAAPREAAPVPPPEPEPEAPAEVEMGLPDVGAGPHAPGLVILKHREGTPFDLPDFLERPARYIEHFQALSRAEDGDDWTVQNGRGHLRTHLGREDLLLVRVQGDYDLRVQWAGVAMERFMEQVLDVPTDENGCYVSLNTGLRHPDGAKVSVPHRMLYCPEYSLALFDAPDGYEIGLSAFQSDRETEYTEAGTSIADNLRLYVQEIHPRRPSARATGRVGGNVAAGFRDAGGDAADVVTHLIAGDPRENLHTGQAGYRPSPISAPPRAALAFLRLHPVRAVQELFMGAESAIQAAADVTSAVHNTVVTLALQGTVGLVSPASADVAGDWLGAFTQSAVKNLPFGERSNAVIDPRGSWYHDRAFEPWAYTRTDTQLNIDRVMTAATWISLRAIDIHNRNHSDPDPSVLPGDNVVETPASLNGIFVGF